MPFEGPALLPALKVLQLVIIDEAHFLNGDFVDMLDSRYNHSQFSVPVAQLKTVIIFTGEESSLVPRFRENDVSRILQLKAQGLNISIN